MEFACSHQIYCIASSIESMEKGLNRGYFCYGERMNSCIISLRLSAIATFASSTL